MFTFFTQWNSRWNFVDGIFLRNLCISDVFLSKQIFVIWFTIIFINFYNVFVLVSLKISSVLNSRFNGQGNSNPFRKVELSDSYTWW